ncbi:MAG TPA: HEAT repeat domain-containing protein [Kofleriaceae bacterium]|nr:HEAT repeat domain-containing protein [Kofleriaceae bacterium]
MGEEIKGKTMIAPVAPAPAPPARTPVSSAQMATVMAPGSIPPPVQSEAPPDMSGPTVTAEAGATLPGSGAPPKSSVPPPSSSVPPSSSSGPVSVIGAFATSPGTGVPGIDDPEQFIGKELCAYMIERKLAEGGMGVVFEGVHTKIGRRGAIKVLKLEFCRSEEVIERFHQEARAVNAIHHENIVDVYDFGRDPHGRVFFVMEFLEGEPLSARIRRGPLPWAEAFPILGQTLRALKAAHDKGFVHRDLKPDNIWLCHVDGRVQVKLLDFGIAKLIGTESPKEKLTQTGSVIGTPHYMSPEQINGLRTVDHRTDLYALGVITYEMFAGITPFTGDTLQAIMTGHLFKDPPRLADIPADLGVPAPIAEIVDRMLVKEAADRYESAADVLADLHDVNKNLQPTKAATRRRARPTRTEAQAQLQTQAPGQTQVLAPVLAPAVATTGRKGPSRPAVMGALVVAGLAVGGAAIWQRQTPTASTPAPGPGLGPTSIGPPPTVIDTPPPVPDYDAIRKHSQATVRAGLRETEPAVRSESALLLGTYKDQPSVPALTDRAESDPDEQVRARMAVALGAIGAAATSPLLQKLERTATSLPLKIGYAAALARLGDRAARRRMAEYAEQARRADIKQWFLAGTELAEISPPGDLRAIKTLQALAAHEDALRAATGDPYVGVRLLRHLVALRHEPSRKVLYAHLEDKQEGVRLAAAEALALLGDGAGKKVLAEVLANDASPNRLIAAVAQIPLGEYGGLDLITAKLHDRDPEVRRLAARALGEIGDSASLRPLQQLADDKSWMLRLAGSAALVAIVGLDPVVLAQASVDWTKSALGSQDMAVRKAAAGVLADIPEKAAVPLLAKAIADDEPSVRLAATQSAAKMKTPEAASALVAVVKTEKDPKIKEQQLKALGEIGSPVAKDTLAEIASADPGRIGVIAAGSLIAVGDPSGKDKLEAAVAPSQPTELRLAAVEAATSAKNPIVVPTLKTGVVDRVFDVRLMAAEGLAVFNAEKDAAVKVLSEALKRKETSVISRAMAALVKFGQPVPAQVQSPAEMVASKDPKLRLAAVPIVRAMPTDEGVPLLRRLVIDPDEEVRRASVDAIEVVVPKDKAQAIKLYKPLVSAPDPVVRTKAAGQLSKLVPEPPKPPPRPPGPPGPGGAPGGSGAGSAASIDTTPQVQAVLATATKTAAETQPAAEAFEALVQELTGKTTGASPDGAVLQQVGDLAAKIGEAALRLESVAARAEAAALEAADVAGPSPPPAAEKLVAEARRLAQGARVAADAARAKVPAIEKQARGYKQAWTDDAQMLVNTARAAMIGNNLTEAAEYLDKAAKLLRAQKASSAEVDYLYVDLYVSMADNVQDPDRKRKLLEQAQGALQRLGAAGGSPQQMKDATAQVAELAAEVEKLKQP